MNTLKTAFLLTLMTLFLLAVGEFLGGQRGLVTALIFAGVGPVLWILYAWLVAKEVRFGQALRVTARTFALTLGTSLWWIAGLRMQGTYGLDVLKYSETVAAVARTSTPNEVLRGLGYSQREIESLQQQGAIGGERKAAE